MEVFERLLGWISDRSESFCYADPKKLSHLQNEIPGHEDRTLTEHNQGNFKLFLTHQEKHHFTEHF